MNVKQVVVLAMLYAAVMAHGVTAVAQAEGNESYPAAIDINKMDSARRAVGPYSFYVPPYRLYYFHHIDQLNAQQGSIRRAVVRTASGVYVAGG